MRGTGNLRIKVEGQKPHAVQKIMISEICSKVSTPVFLTGSPDDFITLLSLRTPGVNEGGRKYTRDLGHQVVVIDHQDDKREIR